MISGKKCFLYKPLFYYYSSMKRPKPPAALSLDLDNQWSYMKIHGDEGWDQFPTYLPVFLPYVLNLLDELTEITFSL